ncbi:hypothetical protein RhiJN_25529 [Ceratobasidium sp. AG-Ba]|nr:hypothetical protein RhiJN_25529 [Ceratobasidium sp. AG-Ba]
MPDQFATIPNQFVPYPSPVTSRGSPSSTPAVDLSPSALAFEWPIGPSFEDPYGQAAPRRLPMTAEDMETIHQLETFISSSAFPSDFNAFPQDPQAGQLDVSPTSENVVSLSSFGSNHSYPINPNPQTHTPHDSPTRPPRFQTRYHPALLSPLALNAPVALPPSPPFVNDNYYPPPPRPRPQLQSQPYDLQQRRPPLFQPPTNQIQRYPHAPERVVAQYWRI